MHQYAIFIVSLKVDNHLADGFSGLRMIIASSELQPGIEKFIYGT